MVVASVASCPSSLAKQGGTGKSGTTAWHDPLVLLGMLQHVLICGALKADGDVGGVDRTALPSTLAMSPDRCGPAPSSAMARK